MKNKGLKMAKKEKDKKGGAVPGGKAPSAGKGKKHAHGASICDIDPMCSITFTSAINGMFLIDDACRYLDVNPAGCAMFGYGRNELMGADVRLLLYPQDTERAAALCEEFFKKGGVVPECRMRRKDGTELWVEMTVSPFTSGGKSYSLVIKTDVTRRRKAADEILQAKHDLDAKIRERTDELLAANAALRDEISERERTEDALRSILEGISNVAGEEFLSSLVRHIASALRIRYAFVGEITGDEKEMVRTLAVWAGGSFAPNFEYGLKDTPCANVAGQKLCIYPEKVQELFPKDQLLTQMNVHSYIGVPLFASDGSALGILVALDDKPLSAAKPDPATVLTIFGARAALELERKRLDLELKKSLDTLNSIMDNTLAIVFLKDKDGKFIFMNKRYESVFKIKRETIIGKTDYDLFPREIAERLRVNDREVLFKNSPLEFEEAVKEPDGSIHTYISLKFPIPSMPGAVCGISTDITDRKRAEEALKRSEERLREAQQIASIGSWEWDITANKLYWSDEVYRMFGVAPNEFNSTYEKFLSFVHPDDRDAVYGAGEDALRRVKPYFVEYRLRRPDGSQRMMRSKAEVTFDENGAPLRVFGTVQDITDAKKMEEEILKAQKLESIGTLAGGIAHDFNNVLLGILGSVSIARSLVKSDNRVSMLLEDVEKAAMRAKGMTRQLLTFSKGGRPVKELAPIDDLVRNSAGLMLKGTDIECGLNLKQDLWLVEMDEGQITQVVNNIILNAVHATQPGGRISISAVNTVISVEDSVPLPPGDYVKVSVSDRGHGIPLKNIAKVFDPFFTTKNKASGLGLAVSYSIIMKHNGYIGVESIEGEGSTFYFYLPAVPPRNNAAKPVDAVAAMGRGRVLVMDDEDIVRDVSGEMLKLMGYEPYFACDGHEAIDAYKEAMDAGAPFTAVIMDLTIPGGMGGKEAVKRLLQIDPAAKVIVSSGYSSDPIMSEYGNYGFKGVIAKPYRVSEFSSALETALKEK